MTGAPFRLKSSIPAHAALFPERGLSNEGWVWYEWLWLLAGPVVAFVLMHFKPFAQNNYLDPYIYTGYINNFADLYTRYGTTYYAVRFGLIIPGQFFAFLLGPVGGYFALRYALVLLSGGAFYAVVRQRYGRAVALTMFAVFVSSPWLARAALWDYPDASGVTFLLAALSFVQLEHRRRYTLDFVAGCLAALAIHSNFFVIAPLGAFLAAYSLLWLLARRGAIVLAIRLAVIAAAAGIITALGVAYYWIRVGQWDIFSVTFSMTVWLASGATKRWRVDGIAWMFEQWAILTPVFLWIIAAASRRFKRLGFHEQVALYGSLATTLFFYGNQFLMSGNSLQLFYYFSYNLPATLFLLAAVVGFLAQRATSWWTAPAFAVAAIVPWVLYALGATTFVDWTIARHFVLAALTLGLAVAASRDSRALTMTTAAAAVSLGLLYWSSFARPAYTGMISSWRQPDHIEREVYDVSLKLVDAMHRFAGPGGVRFWYSNLPPSNPMQSIQSTYLWGYSKVQGDGPGLPTLDPRELPLITAPDVRWLVLLAEQPEQLPKALEALRAAGVMSRPVAEEVLSSGTYHVHFRLLELTKEPQ